MKRKLRVYLGAKLVNGKLNKTKEMLSSTIIFEDKDGRKTATEVRLQGCEFAMAISNGKIKMFHPVATEDEERLKLMYCKKYHDTVMDIITKIAA